MRLNRSKAADYMKPKKKSSQTDSEAKIWSLVDEYRTIGEELREPYERQWLLNLAFLGGRQYAFYNVSRNMIQDITRPGKSTRVKGPDNKLISRWKRQVSDFIRNDPEMSVVPNSEDEEDIQAASIGDKVLKYLWRSKVMRRKWRQLGAWVYSTGNGFLCDRWDPQSGPIELDKSGKVIYKGDVEVDVWSPFEVLVPAIANGPIDIHKMPWFIKYRFRDLSWFRHKYGEKGREVESETNSYGSMDLGTMMLGTQGTMQQKLEGAWMINLYVKPCEEHPQGLFVAAANKVVFQMDKYPLDHYPIEHFVDIDLPGVFWGKSTTEDAIPLQVRWNAVVDDMAAYTEYVAKGRLMAPKKSNVEVMPSGETGELVTYNPVLGHKPEFIAPRGGSPEHHQLLEVIHLSLQDLYHQHEVTRGTNKSDIRSGDMAEFLHEQDAFGGIPTHATAEESIEALFSRVLKRVQKGYTSERTIKIAGEKGRNQIIAFKGADLRNNTDVSVKRQSMLPDSRVLRHKMVENRFQAGFYGDPRDPNVLRRVGRMVEDAVTEDIYASYKLDEGVAESENRYIMQTGDAIPVNTYDNHQIHLEEHNNYRKTPKYQRMKIENPQQFLLFELAFEAHCQQHREFIAQQREAMIQEAIAMKERGLDGKGTARGA